MFHQIYCKYHYFVIYQLQYKFFQSFKKPKWCLNLSGPNLGVKSECFCLITTLLHRLQAQTLPDATPTIGKIHPFRIFYGKSILHVLLLPLLLFFQISSPLLFLILLLRVSFPDMSFRSVHNMGARWDLETIPLQKILFFSTSCSPSPYLYWVNKMLILLFNRPGVAGAVL